MRCAVWFTQLGFPDNYLEYPYTARSPVTNDKIVFQNEEMVENEIVKVLSQKSVKKFGIGQILYYGMPFFCNPIEYISQWCWDAITDYFIVKKFNTPLATSIDNVNIWLVDCFSVIEQELNNISVYEKVKNGS